MHDNEQSRWIATSDLFCVGEIVEYGHQSTHTGRHTHRQTHTHTHTTHVRSKLHMYTTRRHVVHIWHTHVYHHTHYIRTKTRHAHTHALSNLT